MIYPLIRQGLFALDPETSHDVALGSLAWLGTIPGSIRPARGRARTLFGVRFANSVGLAAGLDKDVRAVLGLARMGFGHIEVGTLTPRPQPGNPRPRLFRLPSQRALINRMGFNNEGADAIAKRLRQLRERNIAKLPIIGVNIGKSKVTPVEEAASDYAYSAKLLSPYADYLAVNVSSPNTPGLRSLQEVAALRPILEAVLAESNGKPVLVKIAPDLNDQDIIEVAKLATEQSWRLRHIVQV